MEPGGPGPSSGLASAVDLARAGGTDQLGRLLAPAGVRYMALLTSLAPEIDGEQNPTEYPVPGDVAPALARQLDLSPVLSGTGITVYVNSDWLPQRAQAPAGTPLPRTAEPNPLAGSPGSGIVRGAEPVLPGPKASESFRGTLTRGTVPRRLGPGRTLDPDWSHRDLGPASPRRSDGPPGSGWPGRAPDCSGSTGAC